jgi:hypothetical protein
VQLGEDIARGLPGFSWPDLPDFSWPPLPRFQWPTLPDPPEFDIPEFPGWPTIPQPPDFSNLRLDLPPFLERFTDGDVNRNTGTVQPQRGTGGGANERTGSTSPSIQTGGRITETGMAEVHRGELVADPDRLVSDLAEAVNRAGGGGGGDVQRLESKLDTLHRDLRQLQSVMSQMTIEVDRETLGRVASEAERDLLTDTDALTD